MSLFARIALAAVTTLAVLSAAVAPALAGAASDAGRRLARAESRPAPSPGPTRRVSGAAGALALAAARDNAFGSPGGRIERRVPVPSQAVVAGGRTAPRP